MRGPRCGGAEAMEAGMSWWRRADGRWERGSAPHEWGCCWGSAWGWWPAACDPSLPSACASVEVGRKNGDMYPVSLKQTQGEFKNPALNCQKAKVMCLSMSDVLSSFNRLSGFYKRNNILSDSKLYICYIRKQLHGNKLLESKIRRSIQFKTIWYIWGDS